jgi:hypothetical protein
VYLLQNKVTAGLRSLLFLTSLSLCMNLLRESAARLAAQCSGGKTLAAPAAAECKTQ